MKVGVISDLHVNFSQIGEYNPPAEARPDVLIIAGDVAPHIEDFVALFSAMPKDIPILFVAGNHEYENKNVDKVPKKLKKAMLAFDNVTVLEEETIVIGNVKFIGATLWTDFSGAGEYKEIEMAWAKDSILDFNSIRMPRSSRFVMPHEMAKWSMEAQGFIQQELSKDNELKKFVITHFAPHLNSVHPKYEGKFNSYWVNDLTDLVVQADYWAHGHVHSSFDYVVEDKCRVVCNPRGYARRGSLVSENPEFDLYKFINVD